MNDADQVQPLAAVTVMLRAHSFQRADKRDAQTLADR